MYKYIVFYVHVCMRLPNPEHIKSAVINAWLMGNTRDEIAAELNISKGSVSNIKNEWQNRVGVFEANSLRIGIGIKKGGNNGCPMR